MALRVLRNTAWPHVCKLVVDLPKHKYSIAERPSDFRKWDRKAWTHRNVCVGLGMSQDPGNAVPFVHIAPSPMGNGKKEHDGGM